MGDEGSIVIGAIVVGTVLLIGGIRQYFKKKMIENTPTSKVRSIAMGFVELAGKVAPEKEVMKSPFTNSDCVYYKYIVQEYRRSGKSSYWATIKSDSQCTNFYLKDATGQVLVDPQKAKIDIPYDFRTGSVAGAPHLRNFLQTHKIRNTFLGFGKRMRYTEYYLAPNDKIYILGSATSRPDSQNSVNNEDKILIKKGTLNKIFYISDSSEAEILKKYKWQVPLMVFGGLALALGGLAGLFFLMGIL